MDAVIGTGGKQERVREGQVLHVELLPGKSIGDEVTFRPLLLLEGADVVATPGELSRASVTARVVAESKGPKVRAFTYKPKTNNRRRWGHRQRYATIEITGVTRG
jgi:large subunit ribosomal protein L21